MRLACTGWEQVSVAYPETSGFAPAVMLSCISPSFSVNEPGPVNRSIGMPVVLRVQSAESGLRFVAITADRYTVPSDSRPSTICGKTWTVLSFWPKRFVVAPSAMDVTRTEAIRYRNKAPFDFGFCIKFLRIQAAFKTNWVTLAEGHNPV